MSSSSSVKRIPFSIDITLPVAAIKRSGQSKELFTFYDPQTSRATFPPCLSSTCSKKIAEELDAPTPREVHEKKHLALELSHRINVRLLARLCMTDHEIRNNNVSFNDRVRFLIYPQKNVTASPRLLSLHGQSYGGRAGLKQTFSNFKLCDEVESDKAWKRLMNGINDCLSASSLMLRHEISPCSQLEILNAAHDRVFVVPMRWSGKSVSVATLERHVVDRICLLAVYTGSGASNDNVIVYAESVISDPSDGLKLKCITLLGGTAYAEQDVPLKDIHMIVQTSADTACGGAFWFRSILTRGRQGNTVRTCTDDDDDKWIGGRFSHNFITKYASEELKGADIDFEIGAKWLDVVTHAARTPEIRITNKKRLYTFGSNNKQRQAGWRWYVLEEDANLFRNKQRSPEIDAIMFEQITEQELNDYFEAFIVANNDEDGYSSIVQFARRKNHHGDWEELARNRDARKTARLVYVELIPMHHPAKKQKCDNVDRRTSVLSFAIVKCKNIANPSSSYVVFKNVCEAFEDKGARFREDFQNAGHELRAAVERELDAYQH